MTNSPCYLLQDGQSLHVIWLKRYRKWRRSVVRIITHVTQQYTAAQDRTAGPGWMSYFSMSAYTNFSMKAPEFLFYL